jgi:hypothetical protein
LSEAFLCIPKGGFHLLLLIAIGLTTVRRDLAAVAGDARQRCAPYTDPMILLVTRQCQGVLRSGPLARRRTVSGLPEDCKLGWARIEEGRSARTCLGLSRACVTRRTIWTGDPRYDPSSGFSHFLCELAGGLVTECDCKSPKPKYKERNTIAT